MNGEHEEEKEKSRSINVLSTVKRKRPVSLQPQIKLQALIRQETLGSGWRCFTHITEITLQEAVLHYCSTIVLKCSAVLRRHMSMRCHVTPAAKELVTDREQTSE